MDKQTRANRWAGASGECPSGKVGYLSRAGAKRKAVQMRNQGKPGLRPYPCPDCSLWHIGHKPHITMKGAASAQEFHAQRRAHEARTRSGPGVRHPVDASRRQHGQAGLHPQPDAGVTFPVQRAAGDDLSGQAAGTDEELPSPSGP